MTWPNDPDSLAHGLPFPFNGHQPDGPPPGEQPRRAVELDALADDLANAPAYDSCYACSETRIVRDAAARLLRQIARRGAKPA